MTDPTLWILDQDTSCRDSLCELGVLMGLRIRAFSDAALFLEALQPEGPGCLIMEARLPDRDACDVQDELHQRAISLPVIIHTVHSDVASVVACMKRGAVEFLEKPFPAVRLRLIIQEVIDEYREQWNRELEQRRILTLWDELSEDEREVAQRLALGETNNQIAQVLEVSLRTVQFRKARLMSKMQVSHRAELVALIFKAVQAEHPAFSAPVYRDLRKIRLKEFLGIGLR